MSRGPDASTLLRRALERHAQAAGCPVAIDDTQMIRWASATFVGARHRLTLVARDDAACAAWLAAIGEAELPTRGHLVAEVEVASLARDEHGVHIVLEALTVEI